MREGRMRRSDSIQSFEAPWGRPLRWTSLLLTVLMAVVGGVVSLQVPQTWLRLGVPMFLAGMMGITWLFRVRGYVVYPGLLEIRRSGWTTRVPLTGLRSVGDGVGLMRGSIRLAGNGGMYAFTGWYWNLSLGRYRMWLNDAQRAVLLDWGHRRVIVAPDDSQAFMKAIREASGLARGDQTNVTRSHG